MTYKEFVKKIKHLLEANETIDHLGFIFNKKKYRIVSQYGSGENREFINLWAKKIRVKSDRIYPFDTKQVDKLKFFKIK